MQINARIRETATDCLQSSNDDSKLHCLITLPSLRFDWSPIYMQNYVNLCVQEKATDWQQTLTVVLTLYAVQKLPVYLITN